MQNYHIVLKKISRFFIILAAKINTIILIEQMKPLLHS